MKKRVSDEVLRHALQSQREEITEHFIYRKLAAHMAGEHRAVLERISNDELSHYNFWKKISGQDVKPNRLRIWWFTFLASFLGLVFTLRVMESGEQGAQNNYWAFRKIKGVAKIIRDEKVHEQRIISLLKDERLEYAGSVVLGLNDALVELTGALAGMTLALRDSRIVAIAGLVTGLAASLSMAASNYLASKEDATSKRSPIKSAAYTGITYLGVVLVLISPYFVMTSIFYSLAATLCLAVMIIAAYTFYITTARVKPFLPQFAEMVGVSLATAAISFVFGLLLNQWFGL